ncbi:hypothetical protein PHMEG_00023684 [Phytophthora megakarya]|uniref:Reverse transcriptase n=1 Tax=Phytophthora megakarya TaxID=4795 RepID=A0A225VIS2_9STRA|nr:hypothetical protein PHMEG_00023684 [Phytophthora megakarya]
MGKEQQRRTNTLTAVFASAGLIFPPPECATQFDLHKPTLNVPLQKVVSEFIRRTRMQLYRFTELWRGQTSTDYRPNTAIDLTVVNRLCSSYKHVDHLRRTASEGIRVHLIESVDLNERIRKPANHPSATDHLCVLMRNVRKEQDAGRSLVLDLDILEIWHEVVLSLFGVVAKGDKDLNISGRTIHDLSFPEGNSVNDATDTSVTPKPVYKASSSVAKQVLSTSLHSATSAPTTLMGVDVALAFRNVGIHSKSVYLFGGRIPQANALVIDLFAAFGWTLSPAEYEIYGGAIAHIHGSTICTTARTPFYNYHWVDDHVTVVHALPGVCEEAERSLRRAMIAEFGPLSINEETFTGWHERLKVLGLIFDSSERTVSMPASKISKARKLVISTIAATSITRTELRSQLGSLRHVGTCIRPARAFQQRLRSSEIGSTRTHRVPITSEMIDDLYWWLYILDEGSLNGVPLHYFADSPIPDVEVYVDASNYGLAAIDITRQKFITYVFSGDERTMIHNFQNGERHGFDINYRELLSLAFAVYEWGSDWKRPRPFLPLHVRFYIDNTSAVSWQTKFPSRNPRAQTILRLLALWEVQHNLLFSSQHVAGHTNTLADMGSRISQDPNIANSSHLSNVQADLARHLHKHSVADATLTKYRSAFRQSSELCASVGSDAYCISADQSTRITIATRFILDAYERGLRGSSISGLLHGVQHYLNPTGAPSIFGHAQIRMLLKGIRRLDQPSASKSPVTLGILEECYITLDPASQHDRML